jgi:predicted Fe-Mo cluster-binding NifX family protein
MKIAVPTTQSNSVDAHFGHCEFYTIFTIGDNKNIESKEIIQSPKGCGCKSNIVGTLRQIGVEVMLAGNMGEGAVNILSNNGIAVYRGCSGDVTKLVEEYVNGHVDDSGETCSHREHHGEDHQCNH